MGMTKLKTLDDTAFWKGLLSIEKTLLVICSISSTCLIVAGVIMRYIFKSNFYGSEEIIMLFAFWLYFMGAAYGSFEDSHIKADLVSVFIKNVRVKDGLKIMALAITSTVNLILLKWAYDYLVWGLVKMPLSTGLKIPLVIPQSAIFVGLCLMAFYHIYYLIRDTKAYFKNDPSPKSDNEEVSL